MYNIQYNNKNYFCNKNANNKLFICFYQKIFLNLLHIKPLKLLRYDLYYYF